MLKKKLFRDIKKYFSQFITIFMMVFLGIFVFAGIHGYMDGMQISGDNYYKENNLQDVWVTGKNLTDDDLDDIKDMDYVNDANRVLTITTSLQEYKDVSIETNFIEDNTVNKMAIIEGEKYSKDSKGLYLDSYLAKNLGIKVNDKVSIKYGDYKIDTYVAALINVPDHTYATKDETEIFPTHKDFGYAYLSINCFPSDYIFDQIRDNMNLQDSISNEMIENMIPDFNIEDYYIFNSIIVDVDTSKNVTQVKKNIDENIENAIAVTDRDSSASYVTYNSEIEEGNTYSGVFTALFLFIAILSVITTMNRFIKKERVQIGTLKALGFNNKRIIKHYISYGFFVSLIGAILGLIVGPFTLGKFFLFEEMDVFEVPTYGIHISPLVIIVAFIVVLIITLVTYLSSYKILKESAAQALRIEVMKVKNSNIGFTTKSIFKKLNLSTKWNLRDISRNKARTVMGIFGIIGCCMLLVCAFGMLDTMNSYLDWQFDTIQNYDYKITLDENCNEDQYDDIVKKYGNKSSQTIGIEYLKDNEKVTSSLLVNDAPNYLRITNHNREVMDLKKDGIYITEKMADKLNLAIGDSLKWHIFGNDNYYTSKIVGINRDPQSQTPTMSATYLKSLDVEYKPDSIYTNLDMNNVKDGNGIAKIQSIQTLKSGMQNMLDTMKAMVVLLIFVATILGIVIIYNLGVLSFSEKEYQFATLKVLGFRDKQIKGIFIKQNIWITIIAIIFGLPLGYVMVDFIFQSALGDSYDFNASIKLLSYLYALFGTLIVSFVVNKILSRKVSQIDMVSSLKANE